MGIWGLVCWHSFNGKAGQSCSRSAWLSGGRVVLVMSTFFGNTLVNGQVLLCCIDVCYHCTRYPERVCSGCHAIILTHVLQLYLRVKRFDEAARLMKTGQFETLIDVAYALNFYDQSHFIRDIKAFSGITPKSLSQKRRCFSRCSGIFLFMNMRKHDSSEGTNSKIHSEQFAPSGGSSSY